jgi:uncharacterized membrane protein
MMGKKSTKFSFPVVILDKRIINEPAIVLLGYIALAIVISLGNRTPLQVGLAIALGLFGNGFSTVTVLFPRSHDMDIVERAALSACLSLAIGGILGFALSRSPWGLRLWPFLIITGSYNVICYVLTWYRRRKFSDNETIVRLDSRKLFVWWDTKQGVSNRLISAVLILFLLSGAWMLARNLRLPSTDSPMTEFFLLGQSGQTEAYPKTGRPGEILDVTYGIVNHENAPASYQVKAYIQGTEVGIAQPVNLYSDETQMHQIGFRLLDTLSGQTKVEFVLYREEKPYRFLYLWIDVVNP